MRCLLALCFVLVAGPAWAQVTYPHLLRVTWDPNPAAEHVTSYVVAVNGAVTTVPGTACLATVCAWVFSVPSAGPHTVSVSAVRVTRTSDSSAVPFSLNAAGAVVVAESPPPQPATGCLYAAAGSTVPPALRPYGSVLNGLNSITGAEARIQQLRAWSWRVEWSMVGSTQARILAWCLP